MPTKGQTNEKENPEGKILYSRKSMQREAPLAAIT